ncbi:MAG TPA: sensor histidine kinase N-terminal domain-containing protein [Casimicrobiaceae bacterium]|jgi:two-component system sensor histidine kinase TctE
MRPRSATLRSQLLRWLLIPLSALFLLDAAGSYILATRLSDRVYDGELSDIARELTLHVRRDNDRLAWDLESDAERTLLLDPYDTIRYAVRTPDGALIAGDADLPVRAVPSNGTAYYDSTYKGEPVRVAQLQGMRGGATPNAPSVIVQVAETEVKRQALTRDIAIDVVLPQLLLILIAGALVWIGVARGLAPLQQLQRAIARRSHIDLSPVSVDKVPGEVDPLLHAINDLMARLDEVLSFQNRFIADAAHQLRTPVAGLKAHIELALREDDPARSRQSLAHLYTAVERISRLVSQLLSLARNEPNTVKRLELVPVDLGKLAFDTTMEWVPEAYRKEIDLGFDGASENVMIHGDVTRLTELINNLLDNAIRYSRHGGHVTVRVNDRPAPRVSVSDDGPTIPVAERERVFERFHRLLGSHTGGSGLGLAIVREIAALHKAGITLEDDADGVGNRFTVTFPRPQ